MGEFRFGVLAVLKQGYSINQATAELDQLQKTIAADMPEHFDLRCSIVPLKAEVVRAVRPSLALLAGAVLILMVVLFVNLSTLILAKTIARSGELALARALGAPTRALWSGLLCEATLLSTVGGVSGLAFAGALCQVLRRDAQTLLPHAAGIRLDWRLGSLGLLLSIGVAAAACIYPALRATLVNPQVLLKGVERSTTSDRVSRRLGSVLIAFQVALSSSLVLVAGILSFGAYTLLNNSDPGFATRDRVGFEIDLPPTLYTSHAKRVAFIDATLRAIGSIPGVTAAAMVSTMPFRGQGDANIVSIDGDTVPLQQRPVAYERVISPAYFKTLAIPLRAGRLIGDIDRTRPVVVISDSLARRLWAKGDPVGRRIHLGDVDRPGYDVIGVVGDVKLAGFDKPAPFVVYLPYWLTTPNKFAFVMHNSTGTSVIPSIRQALAHQDAQAIMTFSDSLVGVLRDYYIQIRVISFVLVIFSVGASTLVLVGVYGTIAYWTEQRHRELAIREALGETVSALQSRVLRQGLIPLLAGLFLGYAIAVSGVAFVRSQFYSGAELHLWLVLLTTILFLCPTLLGAYFSARHLKLVPVAYRLKT
jgi:putative ABC transport system permease protein